MSFFNLPGLSPHHSGAFSGSIWQSPVDKHIKPFSSINPATEAPIATVQPCSLQDYETVMKNAEIAAHVWRTYPAPKRGELVRQMGLKLRAHKTALASLVTLETGKPLREALGEIQEMIDMADFCVGQSRMLYGHAMHSERAAHRMYEQWHPYGITGVISAFNFPVAVWAWNAFLSAICGNVTVWKPATKAPLSAIATHHLCSEVLKENNAPAIFHLIFPQSDEVLTRFINDPRLPVISFTGSTSVGKKIATDIAGRLGKSILELGGNNAVIVDESAVLSLAIPSIVFGAIGTAGQRCTSIRRLIVHQTRYDEVLAALHKAYSSLLIGDPFDEKNHMGPLIDAAAVTQFESALQEVTQKGGNIFYGGERLSGAGFYVRPAIVTNVSPTWPIIQTETFAPILYVIPYTHLEEAITIQNAVPQGLSSALFTQKLHHAELFLSAQGSDCGIANINIGTSGAEIGGAFGGEKETGGGREAGSDAWKAYMRRQTTTINWGDDLPLAQGIDFKLK